MTYSKEVTQWIVELWGLGATAQETVKTLEKKGIHLSLHTVYNKRRSLTAQHLIDELIRKQLSDISGADQLGLRMKYRNELLKILVPQRIEAYSESQVDVNVNRTVELLQEYTEILRTEIQETTGNLQPDNPPEQVHTPQTPPKTSTIPVS